MPISLPDLIPHASADGVFGKDTGDLLIPVQAAHQNGMMPPAVTE
jgi:hypothetical protein